MCCFWVWANQKECIFLRICIKCPSEVQYSWIWAVVGRAVDQVYCASFLLFIPLCRLCSHTKDEKAKAHSKCEALGLNHTLFHFISPYTLYLLQIFSRRDILQCSKFSLMRIVIAPCVLSSTV